MILRYIKVNRLPMPYWLFSQSKNTQTPSPEPPVPAAKDRSAQIQQLLKTNKFVLFLKGSPEMPQCGYSQLAVEILKFYRVKDYKAVDIMKDDELREQLKKYSQWPTYPQFYIDGKLIGGTEILHQMHKEGKLKELLKP